MARVFSQLQHQTGSSVSLSVLTAEPGEWVLPPIGPQSLALELNPTLLPTLSPSLSICTRDQQRVFNLPRGFLFAQFIVPDDLLARAAQDVIRDANLELRANDYVDDASLHHLMALMWMEHKNEHSMGTLYWDSLGVALAVSLLTRHSRAIGKQTFTRGGLRQYALRRCLDYLEANLDSPIRLEHLAKEADVSLSHFSRAFHASVGDPPHRYLQQRRIERAKTLMADRKLSLTDVALASGFADQHHLSRVFRRNTGSTPSYYRRFLGR